MDSNYWYRGTKAVDFRSIPGIWVVSVKVVEIGVEFGMAIGQAARGGSLSGSASSSGGVSLAIPSICI